MPNHSLPLAVFLVIALILSGGLSRAHAAEQCAAQCVEECRPIQNDCSRYERVICQERKASGDGEGYRSCVLAMAGCQAEHGECVQSCSNLPTECAEEEEEEDAQEEEQEDDAQEEEQAEDDQDQDQEQESDESIPEEDDDGWHDIEIIDPFEDDGGGGSGSGGGGGGSDGGSGGGSGNDSGGGANNDSGNDSGGNGDDGSGDDSDSGGDTGSGDIPEPDWSGGPPRIPGWPPAGGGTGNTTINICVGDGACSRGDPHLRSFDRVRFDFQGAGEYHFATSTDGFIDVQVRYQPARGSDFVSLTTALAARVGEHRVTAVAGREPLIQINGEPVIVRSGIGNAMTHESGIIIDRQGAAHRINMTNGVVISVSSGRKFMDFDMLSRERAVVGLGGSNDDNPNNEFATRDGVVVAMSDAELTYEQRYRQFGDSWRIKAGDSLFYYAEGESTANFTDLNFPESHRDLNSLDAAARRNAEKICREAGVRPGPDFDDCLYDVGFTGDDSYAAGYARRTNNSFATLDAPATVAAGSTIRVYWTGPGDKRDLITIAVPGDRGDRFETYKNTNDTDLVELRVPGVPGDYELRYVLASNRQVIVSQPLTVTPVTATLDAPGSAAAGSTIQVRWTGPEDKRNLITLAEPDDLADRFKTYKNVEETGEVELRVPGIPGDYELRYVLASDRQIITRKPLTVTPVTATLDAPGTAAAGSTIQVRWTGPEDRKNLITLAEPDDLADRFKTYKNVNETGEVELRVPGIPGDYELRYVLASDRQIIESRSIKVTPVTATLNAPRTAEPGMKIDVQWTGPANRGDYVAVASPDNKGDRFANHASVTAGKNTVQLKMPEEPGDYVLRYVISSDRQVIEEVPITIK